MDLLSYASGQVSGQIGANDASMHYREKYHRGAHDIPDEIGDYRGSAPDTFPFPRGDIGECLRNETNKKRLSRAAIFDAWLAECRAYDAAGRQDEVPPLPERFLTNGPKLWRDGSANAGKRWR
jgi:hypothetical protein